MFEGRRQSLRTSTDSGYCSSCHRYSVSSPSNGLIYVWPNLYQALPYADDSPSEGESDDSSAYGEEDMPKKTKSVDLEASDVDQQNLGRSHGDASVEGGNPPHIQVSRHYHSQVKSSASMMDPKRLSTGTQRSSYGGKVGWLARLGGFIRGTRSLRRLRRTISLEPGSESTNTSTYENAEEQQQRQATGRTKPELGLDELCKRCSFTRKELQVMYRSFKQDCPRGVVSQEAFADIFQQYFPKGNSQRYANLVFKSFDKDNSGSLSFEEFIGGLSILSRGTLNEKLLWIFQLYDINNDGCISREEMIEILRAIYEMLGYSPQEDADIREHAERVFSKLDLAGDNIITKEEFLAACAQDQSLVRSISCFDTVIY